MQITTQSAPRSRQITTPTPHHSIFTGQVLFLTPNQQCQSSDNTNRVSTAPYDHDHHCYSEQANILSDKSGEESFAAAFHNVVQSSTDNNRTSTNKTFTQTTPHCVTLHSAYSLQPLVQPTVWPQLVVQPVGWTMLMSAAKRHLSGPARTLVTSLGWHAARRLCGQ